MPIDDSKKKKMDAGSNPIATYDRHIKQDPFIMLALAYCNLNISEVIFQWTRHELIPF